MFNYFFLFIFIIVQIFAFVSCTSVTPPPATGIVTISLDIEPIKKTDRIILDTYYIYMNTVYQGSMTSSGALTLENVPVGTHTFEAYNGMIMGAPILQSIKNNPRTEIKEKVEKVICSGSTNYYVTSGVNYVTIPIYCGLVILE